MINGRFQNCYGIKELDLPNIDFASCNKALIYAPNGVMKSSLAKVFEDISNGSATKDRIFTNEIAAYSITHYTSRYSYNSSNTRNIPKSNNIYVINSFTDKFEFTRETVSTLLADETTRNAYNVLIDSFSTDIRIIEEKLRILSGLTKPQIKPKLITDLDLPNTADWPDIIEKIKELLPSYNNYQFWHDCIYAKLFSDKALELYSKPEFTNSIDNYTEKLNELLSNSPVLSEKFDDNKAEKLGKDLGNSELFTAKHTIHLRDGVTVIHSLEEWDVVIKQQLDLVYSDQDLGKAFTKLKSIMTKNNDVVQVKDILTAHREIIPLLSNIKQLKMQFWLFAFNSLDKTFDEYYTNISQFTGQIRELYEKASEQSYRWETVVKEFNRRFKVPFKVEIENKANFLLKDESPNLVFSYFRGAGAAQQTATLNKSDLMVSLSMGEKRALYLLYILFDLERIRVQATAGGGQFLIVADDIADSFDYKNKYAIIEYLNDFSKTRGIDLLILTHNFDLYRTVQLRLGVARHNCLIAQRDENGKVIITEFKYQKDFFKKVIIQGIQNGDIVDDNKKRLLIASIPFYRNLSDYGDPNSNTNPNSDFLKLTCLLHLKTTPLDTASIMLSDVWDIIKQFLNNTPWNGTDEKYYDAVQRIANNCSRLTNNEVLLDNKLVISIGIRLKTEDFLKKKLMQAGVDYSDSSTNQTRDWFERAKPYLTLSEIDVIDEVNLITPENIHLNAFMYEPLIDISDWTLKELFNKVNNL